MPDGTSALIVILAGAREVIAILTRSVCASRLAELIMMRSTQPVKRVPDILSCESFLEESLLRTWERPCQFLCVFCGPGGVETRLTVLVGILILQPGL